MPLAARSSRPLGLGHVGDGAPCAERAAARECGCTVPERKTAAVYVAAEAARMHLPTGSVSAEGSVAAADADAADAVYVG